ncbi:MAG: Na/Pi symporter [Proteobacteria bacterium]|jgi:phosphate:Na+ symporter|nr:Na/Pi symporter [Pseudomonadota bacterium]
MLDISGVWAFVIGLSLFLYGMKQLEFSIQEVSGPTFRRFLRASTSHRIIGVINGALATAVLQSSSLVLMITIAFAGAGILQLSNALGIVLGANLGTTMTGWLVSLIGFKIDLDQWIYPLTAFGLLGFTMTTRPGRRKECLRLILGVGFFLWGLSLMKTSLEAEVISESLKSVVAFGPGAVFFLGFLVTAILHSSSAMMTIVLAAVHSEVLPLELALFVVIGAELGTTMTALVAGFQGGAVKKRVGLAHFIYNLATSLVALLIVYPALSFLDANDIPIQPIFQVTIFHTGINALGILFFFPLLGPFEKLLGRFFLKDQNGHAKYIRFVPLEITDAALSAALNESKAYLASVRSYQQTLAGGDFSKSDDMYLSLKLYQEEIIEYLINLRSQAPAQIERTRVSSLLDIMSLLGEATKAIKDISHNVKEFSQDGSEVMTEVYQAIWKNYELFFLDSENENLSQLSEIAFAKAKNDEFIFKAARSHQFIEGQTVSLLNLNRELHLSLKSTQEALLKIEKEA